MSNVKYGHLEGASGQTGHDVTAMETDGPSLTPQEAIDRIIADAAAEGITVDRDAAKLFFDNADVFYDNGILDITDIPRPHGHVVIPVGVIQHFLDDINKPKTNSPTQDNFSDFDDSEDSDSSDTAFEPCSSWTDKRLDNRIVEAELLIENYGKDLIKEAFMDFRRANKNHRDRAAVKQAVRYGQQLVHNNFFADLGELELELLGLLAAAHKEKIKQPARLVSLREELGSLVAEQAHRDNLKRKRKHEKAKEKKLKQSKTLKSCR